MNRTTGVQWKLLQTVGAQLPESMTAALSSAVPRHVRRRHVRDIAIGSSPTGSAIGATPSASTSISRPVLWAGTWMPGGVVGLAAVSNDKLRNLLIRKLRLAKAHARP